MIFLFLLGQSSACRPISGKTSPSGFLYLGSQTNEGWHYGGICKHLGGLRTFFRPLKSFPFIFCLQKSQRFHGNKKKLQLWICCFLLCCIFLCYIGLSVWMSIIPSLINTWCVEHENKGTSCWTTLSRSLDEDVSCSIPSGVYRINTSLPCLFPTNIGMATPITQAIQPGQGPHSKNSYGSFPDLHALAPIMPLYLIYLLHCFDLPCVLSLWSCTCILWYLHLLIIHNPS